ncbi:MAG: hypothetical protein K8S56_07465, partial [Candidatus Cloacimonetes bacterium]|nr:hypothetical protein [Candidatus Cloacimonadota bacterium]
MKRVLLTITLMILGVAMLMAFPVYDTQQEFFTPGNIIYLDSILFQMNGDGASDLPDDNIVNGRLNHPKQYSTSLSATPSFHLQIPADGAVFDTGTYTMVSEIDYLEFSTITGRNYISGQSITWISNPMTNPLTPGSHCMRIKIIASDQSIAWDSGNCRIDVDTDSYFYNAQWDYLKYVPATGLNDIRKPYLIVEGFDPLNTTHPQNTYDKFNDIISQIDGEFDIWVLSFCDSRRPLEDNMYSTIYASRFLKSYYSDLYNNGYIAGYEGTRVMGYSMGGLVARAGL